MKFSSEQMARLSQWESSMRSAVRSGWARGIGSRATLEVASIYEEATGQKHPVNVGCGPCILDLLQRVGRLYFAQKEAQESKGSAGGTDAAPKDKQSKKDGRNGK